MTWDSEALCARHRDLPWTDMPSKPQAERMLAICAACPVIEACRADMEQYGDKLGVRAGVNWTVRGSTNRRRRTRPERTCAWCGVVFHAEPGVTHCSRNCETRTAKMRDRRCEHCGGAFRQDARRARKFCSPECRNAAASSWAPRGLRGESKPRVPATVAQIGAQSRKRAEKLRAKRETAQ